jgi:hypothetical protein
MKTAALATLVGLFCCTPPTGAQQPPQKFYLSPGDASIELVPASPGDAAVAPKVTGTFTVRKSASFGDPPIDLPTGAGRATRAVTGGGCLVFQPRRNPRQCASDRECPAPQGGRGYCVAAIPGAAGRPGNTCWFRPDSRYCFMSPSTPLRVDHTYRLPFGNPRVGTTPVAWRVVTCQNLAHLGCQSGTRADKRHRFGRPVAGP